MEWKKMKNRSQRGRNRPRHRTVNYLNPVQGRARLTAVAEFRGRGTIFKIKSKKFVFFFVGEFLWSKNNTTTSGREGGDGEGVVYKKCVYFAREQVSFL